MPSGTRRTLRACPPSVLAALLIVSGSLFAQEVKPTPVGAFLTLSSPITDESIGLVRRQGLRLQDVAIRENRPAYLVLEVPPGQSQFHHVYALADFLTSPSVSNVRTIAWMPQSVTGHNALLALACSDIVTAPDVRLGDLGQGEALPPDQAAIVLELVARRRNPLVSEALARAMINPAATLLQLTVETAGGARERRLATPEEAARLQASGVAVPESRTLKEPGTVGTFSAEQARAGDFLVRHIAAERRAVADLYRLPVESLREAQQPAASERISVIEVNGSIDSVLRSFLDRQIQRAVEGGADLILFEIHSPGGQLDEVQRLAIAIARLSDLKVRTVAWVPKMATGEAAIVALGCDEIYLAPEAKLGAVARRRKFDLDEAMHAEEGQNPARDSLMETMQQLADLKRRPAAVLLAMADPDLHVFQATNKLTGEVTYMTDQDLDRQAGEWLRGPLVPESGQGLLEVSGLRAQQLMVAEPPVASFDEIRLRLGLAPGTRLVRVEKTWVDDLIFTLNRPVTTGILFTVALICIYLEMHFMSGFLGIVATVCFALFFWSRFLGGTAGSLEVILFLLGMGCLALELFVLPGFGVFGVSGVLLVLSSLVMASQTFGSVETGRDFSQVMETLKTISASIVTVIVTATILSRFLPSMPFLREMILVPPGARDATGALEPRLRPDVASGAAMLVGARGSTVTALRPAGKARIDDRLLDVVSNGPFIAAGCNVEVVSSTGNHIVVREV